MATSPSATTALIPNTTGTFSADDMKKIHALLAWMKACNANPNLIYNTYRYGADPSQYVQEEGDDLNFYTIAGKPRNTTQNIPDLSYYAQAMRFAGAVNAKVKEEKSVTVKATNPASITEFKHGPTIAAITNDAEQLALADDITNTFTEFRKNGLFAPTEAAAAAADTAAKGQLDEINKMHDYALGLKGGNNAVPLKFFRRVAKSLLISVGYPWFAFIGGGISIVSSIAATFGYDARKFITNPTIKYYLGATGLTSSIVQPPFGLSGEKYLREAGLLVPSADFAAFWNFDKASRYNFFEVGAADAGYVRFGKRAANLSLKLPLLITNPGTRLSGIVAEGIVKMLLFPIKWALEYDQWSAAAQARFDAIENTLIGLLMFPVILINHAYAALLDVTNNLFSAPDKDPAITTWNSWMPKVFQIPTQPKGVQWVAVALFKACHFIIDTIPTIFARALSNTLRSILPSFGVDQETLDTVYRRLNTALYVAALVFEFLIIGWALAAVFAMSAGAGFGATGVGAAFNTMISGFGTFVATTAQSMWTFAWTAVIVPVFSFMTSFFTSTFLWEAVPKISLPGTGVQQAVFGGLAGGGIGLGGLMFGAANWDKISGWFGKTDRATIKAPVGMMPGGHEPADLSKLEPTKAAIDTALVSPTVDQLQVTFRHRVAPPQPASSTNSGGGAPSNPHAPPPCTE